MSTLNVGTIASKTGNSAITIADNSNVTFSNNPIGIQPINQVASQATTSGTSKDFTVPSTARQIFLSLKDFQFTGGTSSVGVQLGDSGGIETSGYVSTVTYTGGGHTNDGGHADSNTIFLIYYESAQNNPISGFVHMISTVPNEFYYHAQIRHQDYVSNSAGYKTLSNPITTVRILTAGGHTLNGGSCALAYI